MAADCSRRRKDADLAKRLYQPPPHVGDYGTVEKSGSGYLSWATGRSPVRLGVGLWLVCFLFTLTLSVHAAGTVTSATLTSLLTALQGGGNVAFATSGTITLTNTLVFTNDTVLDASSYSVTLSGGDAVRLIEVRSNINVTLRSLTLTGGSVTGLAGVYGNDGATNSLNNGGNGTSGTSGSNGLAGGILNAGNLLVINCTLSANNATGGNGGDGGSGGDGGIQGGNGGNGGNGGTALGGAIYNTGFVMLTNCTVSANSAYGGFAGFAGTGGNAPFPGRAGDGAAGAPGWGAGLYNLGTAQILNSTFSGNIAWGGDSTKAGPDSYNSYGKNGDSGASGLGGGIYNAGTLTTINSTFALNKALGGNGGDGGDADVKGGNGGNGGLAAGGGIYSLGLAAITNCTLSTNMAFGGTNGLAGTGGAESGSNGSLGQSLGGDLASGSGTLVLANSILAYSGGGGNGAGAITDAGYNLSSDNSVNLTATGSLKNTDPLLGDLSDNGGPTQTVPLLEGSPAIDRGSVGDCLPVDQRGSVRPQGVTCDAGAYEASGLIIQSSPQDQTVTNGATVSFIVTALGDAPLTYQWLFGGSGLTNQTNAMLTLTNVQTADAGNYSVAVSNASGSVTSAPARLRVILLFSLKGIMSTPTNVTFAFSTQPGLSYIVEYKNSLTDAVWTPLATNPGTGSLFTNKAAVATSAQRFFRVLAE